MAASADAAGLASHTHRTVLLLRQTRPWVLILSVLGFIGCGLMVLMGIFTGIGSLIAFSGPQGMDASGAPMCAAGAFYVFFALFYLPPAIYLWRYGSRISVFAQSPDVRRLDSALDAQKSFWKYVGILTLIVIAINVLGVVVVVGFVTAVDLARMAGP